MVPKIKSPTNRSYGNRGDEKISDQKAFHASTPLDWEPGNPQRAHECYASLPTPSQVKEIVWLCKLRNRHFGANALGPLSTLNGPAANDPLRTFVPSAATSTAPQHHLVSDARPGGIR
jgi:hypothetical protein